jgi:hypothetical protein
LKRTGEGSNKAMHDGRTKTVLNPRKRQSALVSVGLLQFGEAVMLQTGTRHDEEGCNSNGALKVDETYWQAL